MAVLLLATQHTAAYRRRSRPVSDSPIQLISIRPAPKYGRIHRGMTPTPLKTDLVPAKSDTVPDGAVVNIEPLPGTQQATPKRRPIPLGASKVQSKSKDLQGGKWLRVVNDVDASSMYFARSWANGLFGIGTLRANGKAVPLGVLKADGRKSAKVAAWKGAEGMGKMWCRMLV